jgi:hypothetical protein
VGEGERILIILLRITSMISLSLSILCCIWLTGCGCCASDCRLAAQTMGSCTAETLLETRWVKGLHSLTACAWLLAWLHALMAGAWLCL